jgi:hypothetical protein
MVLTMKQPRGEPGSSSATFTTAMVESRGLPTAAELDAFLGVGFTELDVLHVLLAIAIKTISNYSNHLFHTEVDGPLADRLWEA